MDSFREGNWVITPPSSPAFSEKEIFSSIKLSLEDKEDSSHDWSLRMFNCMGEVNSKTLSFHSESYIAGGDYLIFSENCSKCMGCEDEHNSVCLFGWTFDKGSAFVEELSNLFSMAKLHLMQLDSAARVNNKMFGRTTTGNENVNFRMLRLHVIELLIYIRNYIRRLCSAEKYFWIMEKQLPNLLTHLYSIRLYLGTAMDLPDYIINYSAVCVGNKCNQPSYHMFHCHLDVRWLHITLIYQLANYVSLHSNNESQSQLYTEAPTINFKLFENYISLLISDLVIFALKRFQQITLVELPKKSIFTCTCVRELWKLLQLCTDVCSGKEHCQPFWNYVNEICFVILNKEEQSISEPNCSILSLPTTYKCEYSIAFILWLLKDLSLLYTHEDQFDVIEKEAKSNYKLLENVIKDTTTTDIGEIELRIYLQLLEKILNTSWEMKTEPFTLFWEYFHKRLNSLFFVPGTSLSETAIVSKSALGLLVQINTRISSSKEDKNMGSFQLFLRLLGLALKKWQDNPRFWNQIKGRIYSKFSSTKMASLNETGLYHFISLFLTLTVAANLNEVSCKFQSFIKLLPFEELDTNRQELILKSYLALTILHAEQNNDISVVSNAVLDIVDYACLQKDHLNLMRIFIEGLQDLIDCTNNLQLGQYMYINSWISHYTSHCTESDNHRLLELFLSLANKLKTLLPQEHLMHDNQMFLLFEAVWEHVNPFLKKNYSASFGVEQVADIAALLTELAISPALCLKFKSQGSNLFNSLMISENTDPILLCRYLNQVCANCDLHSLNNHDMIFIKGWLKCCIMTGASYGNKTELQDISKNLIQLPEIKQLLHNEQCTLSDDNFFESFLDILSMNYSSLNDINTKVRFRDQVCSYFFGIDKWLQSSIRIPKSEESILQIYRNVSLIFDKIPALLYIKSKANNILQCLVDVLLLPPQIRNPEYKLNPHISVAIWSTLDRFLNGLMKLGPNNDFYISRTIKEMITLYVPRFTIAKGNFDSSKLPGQFSLLNSFKYYGDSEISAGKLIIEILCDSFLKRKQKSPDQNASKALMFIADVVRNYRYNDRVIFSIISTAFNRICDVNMYCDNGPCKSQAKQLLQLILTLGIVHDESMLRNEVMKSFEKLCTEHLAFSARLIFDLFADMAKFAPDLISEVLPRILEKVKEVETKRGVGFDRSLRKGIELIENALNTVRHS